MGGEGDVASGGYGATYLYLGLSRKPPIVSYVVCHIILPASFGTTYINCDEVALHLDNEIVSLVRIKAFNRVHLAGVEHHVKFC